MNAPSNNGQQATGTGTTIPADTTNPPAASSIAPSTSAKGKTVKPVKKEKRKGAKAHHPPATIVNGNAIHFPNNNMAVRTLTALLRPTVKQAQNKPGGKSKNARRRRNKKKKQEGEDDVEMEDEEADLPHRPKEGEVQSV